ncbi:MAG: hypothetical protein R8K48_00475 [Gallionella sp.]
MPARLTPVQTGIIYDSEVDLLNVTLFGLTATPWRQENAGKEGNMRDFATLEQRVVLSNLESINAVLIHQGLASSTRLTPLNNISISQMQSLRGNDSVKKLSSVLGKVNQNV